MAVLNFDIDVNAPSDKVWNALWADANYRKWTVVFMEGSYAESDWEEGSKILFLSPGGNGMSSIILKKDEPNHITFQHVGEIKNNVEVLKNWQNALESYTIQTQDNGSKLLVEIQMDGDNPGFVEYFNEAFPKALAIVKEIAEA